MNETAKRMLPEIPGLTTDISQIDLMLLRNLVDEPVRKGGVPLDLALDTLGNGSPVPQHLLLSIRAAWADSESRRQMLVRRYRMTPAEVRLAELIMDGHQPRSAAETLDVSIHTVRTYLKRLYMKVGVKNLAGLVRALLQSGQE
ncbi:MAG: helix-turn-helix transcriptional regulator [Bryobacteraceae bacterium]|nr:helix-turn-helix transcriptional regulator [Bryobacteraceae bacterium]